MRKILSVLAICGLLLASCAASDSVPVPGAGESYETASGTIRLETPPEESTLSFPAENPPAQEDPALDGAAPAAEPAWGKAAPGEMRAVWFSFLEFQSLLTGRNEGQFRANIAEAFGHVRDAGFNTVFVQVRPYADALYQSAHFPWSHIMTEEEGRDPGFDPLSVMVDEARAQKLRIEAWVNPYRVRNANAKAPLSADSPAQKWLDEGSGNVISYNGGIYFNPASEEARGLIVDGVREIVQNYDVDGIHFDDYFYPTASADFDAPAFEEARRQGETQSLGNWRRENVNKLVRAVYAAVKEIKPDCLFGISPQGNNDNNYNTQFVDTAKWLANDGYVDYICPQIYFGFENTKAPFKRTVEEWNALIKNDGIKLYVGLAPYKVGLQDEWAGEGKDEWLQATDILARMVACAREQGHYGGIAMFRYDSLFKPGPDVEGRVQAELQSLKEIF